MAAHPSRNPSIWTRDQALAAGERGRASIRLRAERRRELSALANKARRATPQEALELILYDTIAELARAPKSTPTAERLARVLLTLEHIRRIQGKAPRPGSAGAPGSSAVAQSGPIGEAPPITPPSTEIAREPIPDPETSDEPPQMSDEV